MTFNDPTDLTGLIQDCEQQLFGDSGYGQISGNTNRLKHFTNLLNKGNDRYIMIAMRNDGTWQMGDTNLDEIPVASTAISAGEKNYRLATEHVVILSVELRGRSDGTWKQLQEIDEQDFLNRGISLSEFMSNANGPPIYYNKNADIISIYPAPDYTDSDPQDGSLRIRFQPPGDYFVYGDTTKQPGFYRAHHQFVSLYASWLYAKARTMTKKAAALAKDVLQWEQIDIPEFYATRSRDVKNVIRPIHRSSR